MGKDKYKMSLLEIIFEVIKIFLLFTIARNQLKRFYWDIKVK